MQWGASLFFKRGCSLIFLPNHNANPNGTHNNSLTIAPAKAENSKFRVSIYNFSVPKLRSVLFLSSSGRKTYALYVAGVAENAKTDTTCTPGPIRSTKRGTDPNRPTRRAINNDNNNDQQQHTHDFTAM